MLVNTEVMGGGIMETSWKLEEAIVLERNGKQTGELAQCTD